MNYLSKITLTFLGFFLINQSHASDVFKDENGVMWLQTGNFTNVYTDDPKMPLQRSTSFKPINAEQHPIMEITLLGYRSNKVGISITPRNKVCFNMKSKMKSNLRDHPDFLYFHIDCDKDFWLCSGPSIEPFVHYWLEQSRITPLFAEHLIKISKLPILTRCIAGEY